MKRIELTKEIKSKIETFTYDGIDEAIKLAEEHGTIDFFDKFLGELQLRCVRYNSDHVCSEAKFFNRGMRVKASHFTYRELLGLFQRKILLNYFVCCQIYLQFINQ